MTITPTHGVGLIESAQLINRRDDSPTHNGCAANTENQAPSSRVASACQRSGNSHGSASCQVGASVDSQRVYSSIVSKPSLIEALRVKEIGFGSAVFEAVEIATAIEAVRCVEGEPGPVRYTEPVPR
jgi:hypothetical protein